MGDVAGHKVAKRILKTASAAKVAAATTAARERSPIPAPNTVHQLKISLKHSEPPIGRRLLVPSNTTRATGQD